MQFNNENEFRDWLLGEVRGKIEAENLNLKVLDSHNVTDILICKESAAFPVLVFIEVKLYKSSHGRIGIGQGQQGKKGKGFQPEVLIKRPSYFDRYLRWVICGEDDKCVFADNETVSKHLAGDKPSEGKQNNIRSNIFNKEKTVEVSRIADEIISWLKII